MWAREVLGDLFTRVGTERAAPRSARQYDRQRMGWSELREGEKKCARRTGIRRGLRMSVVSVAAVASRSGEVSAVSIRPGSKL